MGHNGCDGSQASGPWAIGSGYRFTHTPLCTFAHHFCNIQHNRGMFAQGAGRPVRYKT